jgi:DNA polymerase
VERFPGAAKFIPDTTSLARLAEAAQGCRGCDLFRGATQAVFGAGAPRSALLLVGEQPGDQEDLAGKPFVGPAGLLLDRALEEAGIRRADAYVTNAVKHFKFQPRGKKRIHQKPNAAEIEACRPWLSRELQIVRPRLIVCLGATAARTVFGPSFRLLAQRGRVFEPRVELKKVVARALATIHPSAALRAPEESARRELFRTLVRDLKTAARAAHGQPHAA